MTQEQKQVLQSADKPFWQSKKVFLATLSCLTWTWIIYLMIERGVGTGAGFAIPKELFWVAVFKAFVEVLAIGGQAGLDMYLRLPLVRAFSGPSQREVQPQYEVEPVPEEEPG